ncbi:MAG: putative Fe-S cluster assembly protein SufT, partial [Opitutaceae bacterium]
MTNLQTHTLTEDVTATVIPAGDVVTLTRGTDVHLVQTLGGNVTVRTDRGLFRIARENAGAIGGYAAQPLEAAPAAAGDFSEQAVWD